MAGKSASGIHRGAPGLRRARLILALLFFVALSAALLDFRELLPVKLGHCLASVQVIPALVNLAGGALLPLVPLLLIALVTLLIGRIYCSVVCPLGVLQDVISRVRDWLPGKRRLLPFRAERPWLRRSFVVLTLLGVLAGWSGFVLSLADPYSHYGRVASLLFRPGLTFANNLVVALTEHFGWTSLYRVDLPWAGIGALALPALLLSVVVVMAALRGRLYCNTYCPVGTVLGWLSRRAAFRIAIDAGACTRCASCIRVCKAQCIDLKQGTVDASRCVACYNCVGACDEKGIRYRWSWKKITGKGGQRSAVAQTSRSASGVASHTDTCSQPGDASPRSASQTGFERRAWLKGNAAGLAAGVGLLWAWREARGEASGASGKPAGDVATKGSASAEAASATQTMTKQTTDAHSGSSSRRESVAIAPPGARSVDRFLSRCTACQLCVSACPKHVLQPSVVEYGLRGFMKPRLDLGASFCDYDCNKCMQACPDGALDLMTIEEKQLQQLGVARFSEERCIVKVKGTDCAACSEHCPTKAVETVPYGDNLRIPHVNESLCIGCGACQYACPVRPQRAIEVTGLWTQGLAVRSVEDKLSSKKPGGDFPF